MEIAHVKQNPDGTWKEPHSLHDHLINTAELAAKFASKFNSAEWGYAEGLAHDQGKTTDIWQKYLCLKSGYDADAHLEGNAGKVDHSTPGAKLAEEVFGSQIGRILQYCVAGHHAGLPDWYSDEQSGKGSLNYRLSNGSTDGIKKQFIDLLSFAKPKQSPWSFERDSLDMALWIRMLFSCLVDADFLDTESYMNPEQTMIRSNYATIENLLVKFNSYMDEKLKTAAKTEVNSIRQTILADCRKAGIREQGIFSLTVPTGGGKTLSSLAFALEHALKHKLDRVIYVIPFTSIIEQNVNVFRDALGSEQVIEHHSNLDISDSTPMSRLAAENWDAPVIVTTSVQFFESLFAAKPGRCRKLHNIANSVVILDEAQLVPVEYLNPILQTMELLTKRYNVTFVISTATQPAFESREAFKGLSKGSVNEIVTNVNEIYKKLDRVTVLCPTDLSTVSEWNDIASEIEMHRQVLCIVSDRKSCRELFKLLPSGAYHLSALMCGQHRSDIISEIKNRLKNNEKVQVVSTQLVEAGVDFDFPVVYRAIAGLDSIAQAAGRCNREGKLHKENAVVKVFVPPKKSPPGILRKATETTVNMLKNGLESPLAHENFERFFSELYWKAISLDVNNITSMLNSSELTFQYRSASEKFRIIDDSMQKTIVVPYREGKKYIDLIKSFGPERRILRKLQRYSVNVYTQDFVFLKTCNALVEIAPELFALESSIHYDDSFGLSVDDQPIDPDKLIL